MSADALRLAVLPVAVLLVASLVAALTRHPQEARSLLALALRLVGRLSLLRHSDAPGRLHLPGTAQPPPASALADDAERLANERHVGVRLDAHERARGLVALALHGAPDLLVEVRVDLGRPSFTGFAWVALWLEVKTETGALSKDQVRWHAAARSLGRHVAVVRSVEEARRAVAHARGEAFCE